MKKRDRLFPLSLSFSFKLEYEIGVLCDDPEIRESALAALRGAFRGLKADAERRAPATSSGPSATSSGPSATSSGPSATEPSWFAFEGVNYRVTAAGGTVVVLPSGRAVEVDGNGGAREVSHSEAGENPPRAEYLP